MQGLQVQVLTSDQESGSQKGQTRQSMQQLKHVVGVQKLGLGMSSQTTDDALLCTGQPHVTLCSVYSTAVLVSASNHSDNVVLVPHMCLVLDNVAFTCPAFCIDLVFGNLQ